MPVYKDERRGKYYYSFSRSGQRVRSKDYTNRKDCERDMAKALLAFKSSSHTQYSFSQLEQDFLEEKRTRMKEQSWLKLKTALDHFTGTLGDVRIDKLTTAQYQRTLATLDEKGLSNRYKNKLIRQFKQMCKWAGKRYDVYTNVPDRFDNYRNEEKKEMQILTLDQFHDLQDVIDDPVYYALFTLLFTMGLRIGEANALTWQDVDFEKGTLSVNKTATTKLKTGDKQYRITTPKTSNSVRTLLLPQSVSNALLSLRDKVYHPNGDRGTAFVFGGLAPIPESTITAHKNKYLKLAGLPQIRLHDFRHSCASLLINNGATPLYVSKWLGHSTVSMTLNTYSHLWDVNLGSIAQLIDNLEGQKKQKNVRKNVRNNLLT